MDEQEQAIEQEQEEQQTEEQVEQVESEEQVETTDTTSSSSFESGEEGITVITDIGRTKETIFYSIKGDVHLIHEITLGDVIISVLLAAILVFLFLDRVIRR